MMRKLAKLRPSPNEEAQLLRQERERRRKLRIQQVRAQQRDIALQIRRNVAEGRQRELERYEEDLRKEWEQQQQEKIQTLQKLYEVNVQLIGQAHRSAKENEPDVAAIAKQEEQNHIKAEERYRGALKELKSQRLKDHERQNFNIEARKRALETERERSAKVASLPPRPPHPIEAIDLKMPRVLKRTDLKAFAFTHHNMPEYLVDREVTTKQVSANEQAEMEARKLQELQKKADRERQEQLEKARLRGKQALKKEQVLQDRERFLVELEHLKRADLLRMRRQVSQMPAQIFAPMYKREEMREDMQTEMELAFEEMYTGERKIKGDLVLQLVPEPLPAPSTYSGEVDLEASGVDYATTQETEEMHDVEEEAFAEAQTLRPGPRQALKKLLHRIRSQKTRWSGTGALIPEDHAATAIGDQIPEQNASIETGSLGSEEKERSAVVDLSESKTPTTAGLPVEGLDDVSNAIDKYQDEQIKREEELARARQQQEILLQELLEEKAKLEQMLFEAQQEREMLRAPVLEEANPPGEPVQEVLSDALGFTTESVPVATEAEHTRRVREYQQRLLEQKKNHQKSIEVARQRLMEYQQALLIRYNLTPTSPHPPQVTHPLLAEEPAPCCASLPLSHWPRDSSTTLPAYTDNTHARPLTPEQVSAVDLDTVSSHLHDSGQSSLLLGPQQEAALDILRQHSPDVPIWLTDRIMEKVTQHLPEKVRPSLSTDPSFFRPLPHLATSVPSSIGSESFQFMSRRILNSCHLNPLPLSTSPGPMDSGLPPQFRPAEMQRQKQRLELQDIQRRVIEQREAVALQERQQEEKRHCREEERQRQEEEREQMSRQREALEALIKADAEPTEEVVADFIPEDNRRKLLAALLKAIEDSNGGTLSYLEDRQEQTNAVHQQQLISNSIVNFEPAPGDVAIPSFHPPSTRAAKPPVTRVKLGVMEMMEQHELSAIQEVETPINSSLLAGTEEFAKVLPDAAELDVLEEKRSSCASDSTVQRSVESYEGQQPADRRSLTPSYLRERPVVGRETSPESLKSDSPVQIRLSFSSDSGRSAHLSDPAVNAHICPTELSHKLPDMDHLSSTSISTGSYVTTDPEQNSVHTELPAKCLTHKLDTEIEAPDGSPGSPVLNVDSLFHDGSIQRIIDRYTYELRMSLSSAGKSTATDGVTTYGKESGFSVSDQSFGSLPDKQLLPSESQSLPDAAEAQASLSHCESLTPHSLSDDASLLGHTHGQDSFRPLIAQPADQSSLCLAAEPAGPSMEQLVGHPSAHSSAIGQLPSQSISVIVDEGDWESTLSRMMDRLSHQPNSQGLSGGQQVTDQIGAEQMSSSLGHSSEGNEMLPLVEELDESADDCSISSGEIGVVVGCEENAEPLLCASTVETESHSIPIPDVIPVSQEDAMDILVTGVLPELSTLRSEVLQEADSFHPLLAEVTQNETVDPSLSFAPLTQELQSSTSQSSPPQSWEARDSLSTHNESSDLSAQASNTSPECLRAEDTSCLRAVTFLQESFHQLATSQCLTKESIQMASPTVQETDLAAPSLQNVSLCNATPSLSKLPPESGDECSSDEDSVPVSPQHQREEQTLPPGSQLGDLVPMWDRIKEAASGKGILEQSEITLVSLTDTSLQEHDMTITDQDEHQDQELTLTGLEDLQGEEELEPVSPPKETSVAQEERDASHSVMFLEFNDKSSGDLQQAIEKKRKALLQRSSKRVAQMKAKTTRPKAQAEGQDPVEAKEHGNPEDPQLISCRPKTKPRTQVKPNTKLRERKSADRTAVSAVNAKPNLEQCKSACESRPKKDEAKMCTTEQRKTDANAMFQRTQRLYHQLEEVKQRKEEKNRQEAYAKNRLKAKEFHQKTLEKLRAKRTRP